MQETKLERQDTKRTRLVRTDQPDLVNYIHSTLSQMETELTKYEHEGIFLPVWYIDFIILMVVLTFTDYN